MRALADYTAGDWLRGAPFEHGFKQVRNDIALRHFVRQTTADLPAFLESVRPLASHPLLAVVAFEQPEVLGWLLHEGREHLADARILVFDNSKRAEARMRIRSVCAQHQTPYLALPQNRTRHINRHHGRAMTWIYYNVIRDLAPSCFGFIDHDLIPIRPFSLTEHMQQAPAYGLQMDGRYKPYWFLWAGYCFYRLSAVAQARLNFLYDFGADLDTGGRNWPVLYQQLDRGALPHVSQELERLRLPGAPERDIVVIDGAWMHIGGISYNDAYRDRKAYFDGLEARRRAGVPWPELIAAAPPPA